MAKMKKILLILGCMILLAGCQKEKTIDVSSEELPDYNDYISWRNDIAYTDSAYLFKKGDQIYYLDSKLSAPLAPLCARADCKHRDSRCNAYVGEAMFAYQNKIYYVMINENTGTYSLYRMNIGGTEREEIRSFADILPPIGGWGISFDAGDGYLLANGSYIRPQGKQDFLYLISMENPDQEIVEVYLGDEDGSSPKLWVNNRIFDDWVYYQLYEEANPDVMKLMAYQISTGKREYITEECFCVFMQKENEVYWFTYESGVFACNMDTGKIRQILKWELPLEVEGKRRRYSIMIDHQYIYLSEIGEEGQVTDELGLRIYDLEGREMLFLSYEGMEQPLWYRMATPDYVIFGVEDKYHTIELAYYLKRSAIANGEAEFIELKQ